MTEGLTTIPSPPQRRSSGILSLFANPSRGGAAAARRAHNPEVVGSSPTPATKNTHGGAQAWAPPATENLRPTTENAPWWLERGGTTRSHPEHGSETPQRPRYCPGDRVWKIGRCRELFLLRPSCGENPGCGNGVNAAKLHSVTAGKRPRFVAIACSLYQRSPVPPIMAAARF